MTPFFVLLLSFFATCCCADEASGTDAPRQPTQPKAGAIGSDHILLSDHIMLQKSRLVSDSLKHAYTLGAGVDNLKNAAVGAGVDNLKNAAVGSSLLEKDVQPLKRSPGLPTEEEDDAEDAAEDLAEDRAEGEDDDDEGEEEEDEEDDSSDEEEERPQQQQGEGEDDLARIQRVARLADTNEDSHLSVEEMKAFAAKFRERQRVQQTESSLKAVDVDQSGDITLEELRSDLSEELFTHQKARYNAADKNGDGRLQWEEFHAFVHPELDDAVLNAETDYQLRIFDFNKDGLVDFEEFKREGQQHDEQDFSEEAALEDFTVHDTDGDHVLSHEEFAQLLRGHEILHDNIQKAFSVADENGDGHLHVDDEIPQKLHHLLGSEFIEDFFFHQAVDVSQGHEEL